MKAIVSLKLELNVEQNDITISKMQEDQSKDDAEKPASYDRLSTYRKKKFTKQAESLKKLNFLQFSQIICQSELYKTFLIEQNMQFGKVEQRVVVQEPVTSFYPIFNKKFDHLETLLTICRPKKALPAGSLCRPLVPSPLSKCPKRTFILPQKYHASVSNMLS